MGSNALENVGLTGDLGVEVSLLSGVLFLQLPGIKQLEE